MAGLRFHTCVGLMGKLGEETNLLLRIKPALSVLACTFVATAPFVFAPTASADNKRLNNSVVADVYTIQRKAGCTVEIKTDPRLQQAAEWHARDVLGNRDLDGDVGSDGSTPQDRGNAAGYRGRVSETVAINPALAISGIELINKWYYDPNSYATMSDCRNTNIGVWSENSLDRTVVVAVYGEPSF
jgi:uncharacterized protein YkwD